MAAPIKLGIRLPAHRAKVLFEGETKPCFVLHADKLAKDTARFREIAGILRSAQTSRATALAAWLTWLADEYA